MALDPPSAGPRRSGCGCTASGVHMPRCLYCGFYNVERGPFDAASDRGGEAPAAQGGTADVLMAKLVDTNQDSRPSVGDYVITSKFPRHLDASVFVDLRVKRHLLNGLLEIDRAQPEMLWIADADAEFHWYDFMGPRQAGYEEYREKPRSDRVWETMLADSQYGGGSLRVSQTSPSRPSESYSELDSSGPGDQGFIDVDIFYAQ
jgi:hypothetical protein